MSFPTEGERFATLRAHREKGGEVSEGPRIVLLGTRGSIPVSGAEFVRYGGNTSSFALAVGSRIVAFIDAGTGLVAYGSHGLELAPSIEVFLTHYHWDHIQGLSMLPELWGGGHAFTFIGPGDTEAMLSGAIRPPWFPVALRESRCTIAYRSVDAPVRLGSVEITSFPVNHPQGAIGFRLNGPRSSIALVTDHESTPASDDTIAREINGVDVLIHDAQYLPNEFESRRGWGHSTWEQSVAMAQRVGARHLILTSHAPRRTDREIEDIVSAASARFPSTEAAREGLRVDF
jgi:ribonuclease BN (tRNA processing enzyme)